MTTEIGLFTCTRITSISVFIIPRFKKTKEVILKNLDNGIEAEVLGHFLLNGADPIDRTDREAMLDALDQLKPEQFTGEFNANLYRVIRDLHKSAGNFPSFQMILNAARRDSAIKSFTDIEAKIAELMKNAAATSFSFSGAVDLIITAANKRETIIEAERYLTALKEAETSAARAEVIEEHTRRVERITDGGQAEYCGNSLSEIWIKAVDQIDKGVRAERIPTGFESLDRLLNGGFQPETLNIIAARPSVGKSAMMTQLAISAARSGYPGLIFSLEMSESQIIRRIFQQTTGIKAESVDAETSSSFYQTTASLPLYVYDEAATVSRIESITARYRRKKHVRAVFIDYIGLIKPTVEQEKLAQYDRLDEISNRLKQLAKREKIAVILLAQLNRDSAKAKESRPMMSQLKGSGGLEQNADSVSLLWRPEEEERDKVELILDKQRDGIAGERIEFNFYRSETRFEEEQQPGEYRTPATDQRGGTKLLANIGTF